MMVVVVVGLEEVMTVEDFESQTCRKSSCITSRCRLKTRARVHWLQMYSNRVRGVCEEVFICASSFDAGEV